MRLISPSILQLVKERNDFSEILKLVNWLLEDSFMPNKVKERCIESQSLYKSIEIVGRALELQGKNATETFLTETEAAMIHPITYPRVDEKCK
jgi:hypothetical protein